MKHFGILGNQAGQGEIYGEPGGNRQGESIGAPAMVPASDTE